jgi:hypothetical protein
MRLLFAILIATGFGCGLAAAAAVPLPRPRPPLEAAVTAEPTACDLKLAGIAAVTLLPRLIGPGACGGADMVALEAVLLADKTRVDIKPAPVITCGFAEQLAQWLREDAAPRLAALGSKLRSVENYDSFECRARNRVAGAKISNHGKGIAIDLRVFTLADGRRISPTDETVEKDLREALRDSACARFTTVLGPGAAYHNDHVHLDAQVRNHGYRICEWEVRVPTSAVALADVPLPRPRPPTAPVKHARKL